MIAPLQQAKWRVRHNEAKLEGHTAATGEADKICSLGLYQQYIQKHLQETTDFKGQL